jgi:hypothetical protein
LNSNKFGREAKPKIIFLNKEVLKSSRYLTPVIYFASKRVLNCTSHVMDSCGRSGNKILCTSALGGKMSAPATLTHREKILLPFR